MGLINIATHFKCISILLAQDECKKQIRLTALTDIRPWLILNKETVSYFNRIISILNQTVLPKLIKHKTYYN